MREYVSRKFLCLLHLPGITLIPSLKAECAVIPPNRSVPAIPVEAVVNTFFPMRLVL